VSWCYHGHEHGTNPAALGVAWMPTFGRATAAAGHHGHPAEGNAGFKGMGWVQNGVRWYVGMHQGTAGAARLCVRHHETALAAWDDATGDLLLDLRWMGDYGAAVSNAIELGNPHIVTAACPTQAEDAYADGSHGVRQIGVLAEGGFGYEPWRVDTTGTILGLVNTMLFNTTDPLTMCDVSNGCTLVASPGSGTRRFYQGQTFGVQNPPRTGAFFTDPFAQEVRDGSEPDAVWQYIAPGITNFVTATNKVWDVDGFGRPCVPSQTDVPYVNPTERENGIGGTN
jgi:hypothetical protein